MDKETYEKRLREHLAKCRRSNPIPSRADLSDLEEQQYRVLGGHLVNWLNNWGPPLLSERALYAPVQGWDEDPLICVVTDMPGLVAADEILEGEHEKIVWGLLKDFEPLFKKDQDNVFHVRLHSYFSPTDVRQLSEDLVKKHKITADEEYYDHHDTSIMGSLFARGVVHLWRWDKRELQLLEEAYQTWIS